MKIKKGDTVKVISGKDRGKSGKVLRALPREDLVVVEGVNIKKRHQRATKANQKGQIIDKTMPIHVSNVMLVGGSGKTMRHRTKEK
ncbi:50S ribosomal protein L24 [Candidatus Kaiserbacteria bacterium RIFCSPHIGHO2_02_FULL_50_9]|uniref:Large ribosomal subunit protein uL24 n=1 Tax=Candidatus Kaiserbacteria bacterium RIFCSPLOWO2_01_FULL_51_21 TaxID=1798508 RepID=A0A1F6ECL2_9BACT|nr:MAG: 50S ribosomal protein L24 [Candidatus Kaiserbacteria bacterium RIFCSPHIGHO2_01_FULL_51_33]OGG63357.1 MAG: 50S ribosomal protein L24 [Candidatus Kaiserbacteria bacterium RIFCSPHIGHO2_02_FULL_50_9]OGG71386.1 MAG: 50S ribosomal protein L24 [Candidatus Kaiserbacteria bacterium RIFCSPLOWO2_01_FULL_51_21]